MVLSLATNQDHIDEYDLTDKPKAFMCEESTIKKGEGEDNKP